jgi:hypothetical protein
MHPKRSDTPDNGESSPRTAPIASPVGGASEPPAIVWEELGPQSRQVVRLVLEVAAMKAEEQMFAANYAMASFGDVKDAVAGLGVQIGALHMRRDLILAGLVYMQKDPAQVEAKEPRADRYKIALEKLMSDWTSDALGDWDVRDAMVRVESILKAIG